MNKEKNIGDFFKISCIVPVYKVEKYIQRCVNSILAQTFSNFELILIDDGSPDNSGIICDEYAKKDNRVKVIHKTNGGVSSARNAGIEIAQGEYICFVDSDDWIEPDYMTVMYDTAVKTGADLVVCGYRYESFNGTQQKNNLKEFSLVPNGKSNLFYAREEFLENFPSIRIGKNQYSLQSMWMMLFRNTSWFPRFDETRKLGEDYIFNLSFYEKMNSICYIKPILYNYCYTPGSITKQCTDKVIVDQIYITNLTGLFISKYCPKKGMKAFYLYKKQTLSRMVNSVLGGYSKSEKKNFSYKIDLIRSEISAKILFVNFLSFKQTVPLMLIVLRLNRIGIVMAKFYRNLRHIFR